MNEADRSYLQSTIDNEGLDYALFDYADWADPNKSYYIDDPYFQVLYASVRDARQALIRYLKSEGLNNLH